MHWHLAQLNIARLLHPVDDPRIADFVNGLESINRLAESSEGFVWRFQTASGNATDATHPWSDDPFLLVNMSVWTTPEALREYVYRSGHLEYLRRRAEWFEVPRQPHYVLWWIPEGEQPTLEEAQRRLELYRKEGPTAEAFWFSRPFPAPAEASAGAA